VTGAEPSALLVQRRRLAGELQRLREAAGLTTYELGDRLGVSQSKVSKIENARVAVSVADVRAWLSAVGASASKSTELAQRAEQALTEAVTWRAALREHDLPAMQQEVALLEQTATSIRVFQPTLVPGLLQTADYARRVYLAAHTAGRPDIAAAVTARLERQAVLYDEEKRFEFVITEAALRWRLGPAKVMVAQLDRIRSVATLPNMAIGIIPLTAEAAVWHSHGFNFFEGPNGDDFVHVETLTTGLNISDSNDVQRYREVFERLKAVAAFEEESQELIGQLVDEFRREAK
jgi:transcriptional regulator with XRE-family HTH domain